MTADDPPDGELLRYRPRRVLRRGDDLELRARRGQARVTTESYDSRKEIPDAEPDPDAVKLPYRPGWPEVLRTMLLALLRDACTPKPGTRWAPGSPAGRHHRALLASAWWGRVWAEGGRAAQQHEVDTALLHIGRRELEADVEAGRCRPDVLALDWRAVWSAARVDHVAAKVVQILAARARHAARREATELLLVDAAPRPTARRPARVDQLFARRRLAPPVSDDDALPPHETPSPDPDPEAALLAKELPAPVMGSAVMLAWLKAIQEKRLDGTESDTEVCAVLGVARRTFYRHRRRVLEELARSG